MLDDESEMTTNSTQIPGMRNISDQSPGEIVGGKFRIEAVLGQGGMGTVYLATLVPQQQKIALKILSRNQMSSEKNRRRFENEGKASHSLNHPNLVKVLDYGILSDEAPWIAMEYVGGTSLQNLLKQQESIDIIDVLRIFDQICDGLIYAHKHNVIHRDIKPSNIMVSTGGGKKLSKNFRAKVVDFGIAKIMNEDRGEMQTLTSTGEIFGSPLYMSPEQCKGDRIDFRTDIYSLGCSLFEALTGGPPHVGTNALKTMMMHTSEAAPSLKQATLGKTFPPDLETVLQRMLKMEVDERYQTAEQVKLDLQEVAEELICERDGIPRSKPKRKIAKSNEQKSPDSRKIMVAAAVGILILGATIYGAVSFLKERNATTKAFSNRAFLEKSRQEVNASLTAQGNSRTELKSAQPIPTSIFDKDGKKFLQINFPKVPVGWLTFNKIDAPFAKPVGQYVAKGVVRVPLGARLQLMAGGTEQDGFDAPEIFGKIPDDLISKLLVDKPFGYQISEDAPWTDAEFAKNMAQIFEHAKTWKKLDTVSVCKLPLTDESVAALSGMKNLTTLALWNPIKTEKKLIDKPVLRKITTLYLRAMPSDELVEAVSRSGNLDTLTLFLVVRTPKTCAALPRCKNLQRLHICMPDITDGELASIAKIRSLREVFFDDAKISRTAFAAFMKKCPFIKKVTLSNQSKAAAVGYVDREHRLEMLDVDNALHIGPFREPI